jgi:hypothetical protein
VPTPQFRREPAVYRLRIRAVPGVWNSARNSRVIGFQQLFEELGVMRNLILAAAAVVATIGGVSMAQANTVQLGMLTCDVAAGEGFIFGSSKNVTCTFTPANASLPPENYTGVIHRYGIDVGFTKESVMKWAVLAKSWDGYKAGALGGKYGGVGAEVTAALGVGTNVLGSTHWKECVLQPVSVQGQTGLNIAAGIAELELQPATK